MALTAPESVPLLDPTVFPVIEQCEFRNYKNIGSCHVDLSPLTILVGRNGAGKSNFVDAFSFVADSLNTQVHTAFAKRGGIAAVRRRSSGHPTHSGFSFTFRFPGVGRAKYAFVVKAERNERFSISKEKCEVVHNDGAVHAFEYQNGELTEGTIDIVPEIEPDRLALGLLSGLREFRPVYDFLSGAKQYNIRPEKLRLPQNPDPSGGDALAEDGSNATAVLRRILRRGDDDPSFQRVKELLSAAVPGIADLRPKALGPLETIEFSQDVGAGHAWHFPATNMSDGTLRFLGILLAAYQPESAPLLAIEEPESTIHPGAADILMDSLIDASHRSQILMTTHSPDILHHPRIRPDQLWVVEAKEGTATTAPLKMTTRELLERHLYSAGELLRQDELEEDDDHSERYEDVSIFSGFDIAAG